MKTFFAPAACAAAILLSSVSVDAILAPAAAQEDVSFDSFHDYLANYGDWVYSDRWGEVWIPENVPDDFRPYDTDGHWVYTDDYGWYWASDYRWGDVAFHYGRWVNDPEDGWLWVPGYVWSPAWVNWRSNGQYIGWSAMPPDREFLRGGGPSFGISLGKGFSLSFGRNEGDDYRSWYGRDYDEDRNWVFVDAGHVDDRDFRRHEARRDDYARIMRDTKNVTHYTVENNYVVNRSIDPRVVGRAGGHQVAIMHAAQVIKHPQFVTRADQGQQVQTRMRQERPHGTGTPNSAPAPSQTVIQSLSNKAPQHAGHAPMHVFTKSTVTQAPAFTGKAPAGGAGAMHGPGGAMSGPGGAMSGPGGGPNTREERFKKPTETAPTGSPSGETMHGPAGGAMSGPGGTGGAAAPRDERSHRSHETGGGAGGGMMNGPAGGTPPTERHMTQPMTPPTNETPATSAPTMLHKHENTGGGGTGGGGAMTGPGGAGPAGGMHERGLERTPPVATPAATPPVQREEHRPPVAAPAATPPVQHEEHKPTPAGAPPSKPDDKKDKKDEPHG